MMKKILFLIVSILLNTKLIHSQLEVYIEHEAIVWLHRQSKISDVSAQIASHTGPIDWVQCLSKEYNIWLVRMVNPLVSTDEFIRYLSSTPHVAIAQRNHVVSLRATPNDASFSDQWSLNNTGQSGGTVDADIDAVEAWNITTGGLTALGDTIVVAVIDGGCQINHPDLQANIFRNYNEIPGNGVDDDNNGYIDDINGWNAYNNNGTIPSDQHGTHVSGIIGARGNNNIGVAGVNWNVKILPIAGSSGNEATVVAAYAYAAKMRKHYNQTNGAKGAFVVATNSSFGVDYGDASNFPIWCAFYDTLGAVGILSAGAGPNLNINVDTQGDIPTTCPSNFLIGVTNTTRTDTRNNGAGYGAVNIDIGAPGTQIFNTVNNSGYNNLTGTSMATPHVAGVIALMYSGACSQLISDYKQNPSAIALQMKNYLLTGVDSIPSMQGITTSNGRLNAYKALLKVQSYVCNPNTPPVAGFGASTVSGCPGISVSFTNYTVGQTDSIRWYFPGGTPSTSTANNPIVTYNNLGNYDVTLIAYNSFGSDTHVMNGYIDINNTSVTTIYTENFENGSLATLGWEVVNPDNQNTWNIFSVSGNTPGNQAAGVNIFNNQGNVGVVDALISPVIDLSNFTSVELSFEHAHRRRVTTIRDSLWVSVSSDGGNSWNYLLRAGENGTGTFATNAILNSNFVPSSSSDWCFTDNTPGCFNLNLSAYDGTSNFKIRFEVQNNGGNNIYIDNIKVTGVCTYFNEPGLGIPSVEENINNIMLYPNPTFDYIIIESSVEAPLEIYSIAGQLIQSIPSPKQKHWIEVTNYTSGIYFVKIGNQTLKFVKQ
ncbi:MAG: S8 family serine peptidase [Flavobacteriales bacterium]|nr:S8 family serine peptidase [Flavobacteriales bacterium]